MSGHGDSDDILIDVKRVSKKYCRSLKRSLWYGIEDICNELALRNGNGGYELRPDEFWAVNDISFTVRRGECLGLIGPNGAGKSTLLKMLNGLIKPDQGRITIRGRVGALIDLGAGFNPILTGRENVYNYGSILGLRKREMEDKFDRIIEFAEIGDFIDAPVQNYSSGMKVRLGFSVAAHLDPDVLFIDEVLAVGDIGFRTKCVRKIDQISRQAAIIFVSHSMPQISKICTCLLIIHSGQVVFHDEDIARGIEHYYSQFTGEQNIVTGSRRAAVQKFELLPSCANGANGSGEIVTHSDDMIVDISLSIDPGVQWATVSIVFYTKELIAIAEGSSPRFNIMPENGSQPRRLRALFSKIPFGSGAYSVSVIVREWRDDDNIGEVLVHHHGIKQFQIAGDTVGWAPVQLRGEWEIQ